MSKYADLRELADNTEFYVINGDWNGYVFSKNGAKFLHINETNADHQISGEEDLIIQLKPLQFDKDCISRQAVLEIFGYVMDYWKEHAIDVEPHEIKDALIEQYEFTAKQLNELPFIIPKPKMGQWIMPVQDDGMSDPIYYQVRCSKCGFDLDPQTWHQELHQYGADKYCPNCGAKMEESEGEV